MLFKRLSFIIISKIIFIIQTYILKEVGAEDSLETEPLKEGYEEDYDQHVLIFNYIHDDALLIPRTLRMLLKILEMLKTVQVKSNCF